MAGNFIGYRQDWSSGVHTPSIDFGHSHSHRRRPLQDRHRRRPQHDPNSDLSRTISTPLDLHHRGWTPKDYPWEVAASCEGRFHYPWEAVLGCCFILLLRGSCVEARRSCTKETHKTDLSLIKGGARSHNRGDSFRSWNPLWRWRVRWTKTAPMPLVAVVVTLWVDGGGFVEMEGAVDGGGGGFGRRRVDGGWTETAAFATFQTVTKTGGPVVVATVGGKLIRSELLSSAWTGFFAGCLHTLSGPDHLAALAPFSIGHTRMESAAVGALWGCGHDAGQLIFGLIFLLLKDRLHIEIIRTWSTRVVGLTLLVIGAMGIKEASEVPEPYVAVENGGYDVSEYESLDNPTLGKKIGFATFATGIIHGLQPDALMMVLPALALPSHLAGAAFLIMFLIGTVVAMGSYTVFIGSCSQALKDRVPRITEKLTWASSLVAISLGFVIIICQFFGFSLY
ncbi:hypothetical protein RIF29_18563 [Crotalaria pallida]|uniref:Urease accessory protein UreH-like transmembrane domain-containing protein n=1 Tax=Crotalaria pallida TaxID=3830 RepID=A0AAN9FMC9_CROPI